MVLNGLCASNPVLAILFLSISTLGVIGSMQLYCRCHLHFGRYRCCSWYWHSEFSGQSRRLFRTKYTDMGKTYFFRPFRSLVYYSWNFDDRGRIDLFLHTKDLARQGGHSTDYRLLITITFLYVSDNRIERGFDSHRISPLLMKLSYSSAFSRDPCFALEIICDYAIGNVEHFGE